MDQRRGQSERLFRITAYILCAAFVVALALLFLHYRMLNAELKAREQAEASLRTLSVRLLELQDQERRKFSRELHDSLGQYLVGAKMNLAMLDKSVPDNALIAECLKLLDQAMTETRTISHLLHPPLLDETGFASAARWYVEGFAKRSGIPTSSRHARRSRPTAQFPRAGLVPRSAGKPDQCPSPFHEQAGGCLPETVREQGSAAGKRLRQGHSARTFWTAFGATTPTAEWGWPGCANVSTNLAASWKWNQTAAALRSWQLCRGRNEEIQRKCSRRINSGTGVTLNGL